MTCFTSIFSHPIAKLLDTRQFGRGRKRQYLIKWKGYLDSDNEWVDHKDIHAPEAIREFENSRTDGRGHIRMGATGEYSITPLPITPTNTHTSPMSNDTNNYYLGSPERIFGAELDSQLITYDEVREVFPDLQTAPLQPRPLSPLLREMSDPSGLAATPTHEADTQVLDHELWEAEGVLRIPPRVGGATATITEEGQLTVEGGAIRESRIQEK